LLRGAKSAASGNARATARAMANGPAEAVRYRWCGWTWWCAEFGLGMSGVDEILRCAQKYGAGQCAALDGHYGGL
jgi:hypothetical protein